MEKSSKKYLQITEISEVRKDKNKNDYKRITAKALPAVIEDPMTGEILPVIVMTGKKVSFNQYKESYLDGSKDPAYDAPLNSLIEGAIVSKSVDSYTFPDSVTGEEVTAESYTTAVFGDTSEEALFQTAIFAAFRRAEHPLEGDPRAEIELDKEEVQAAQPVED